MLRGAAPRQAAALDSVSPLCRDSAAGSSWEVGCLPLAASSGEEMGMMGSHTVVVFSHTMHGNYMHTRHRVWALELRI